MKKEYHVEPDTNDYGEDGYIPHPKRKKTMYYLRIKQQIKESKDAIAIFREKIYASGRPQQEENDYFSRVKWRVYVCKRGKVKGEIAF